jgi:hypothetical protein
MMFEAVITFAFMLLPVLAIASEKPITVENYYSMSKLAAPSPGATH